MSLNIQPVELKPRRWWVCFSPECYGWWKQWIKPGFGHAFCFTEVAPDMTVIINPLHAGLEVHIEPLPAWRVVKAMQESGHKVVTVEGRFEYGLAKRFYWQSCATIVAYAVGLPARVFTPYQLFKQLVGKFNGKEVMA